MLDVAALPRHLLRTKIINVKGTEMAILNSAAEMSAEVSEWRRHLHQNPELMFDVHNTAAFVEEKLRAFGCDEIVTGLGRTGVVAVIKKVAIAMTDLPLGNISRL